LFFIVLLAAFVALIAYLATARWRPRLRIAIPAAVFLILTGTVTAVLIDIGYKPFPGAVTAGVATTTSSRRAAALPAWIAALIEQQPSRSRLVIEEVVYDGRRAFLVMPPDRGFDTGNEHVLHSEDGRIICEFGGFVGQVTAGACDIQGIKYVRTVFGRTTS